MIKEVKSDNLVTDDDDDGDDDDDDYNDDDDDDDTITLHLLKCRSYFSLRK